ncbi:MAG: nitronate monooxygenase [Gammaproteobacteria bacterium]|nr:nitronate monooxygenase [Gammaproteobacteria bacterium]
MAQLRTPICERLGIDYPVFQAGMGWVARAELAAAVSQAGGLGVIGAGSSMEAEELRADIRRVREVTDKPFGVDILFATIVDKGELGVASGAQNPPRVGGAGAAASDGEKVSRYTDTVQKLVDVVLEERVPVLISGLGSPAAVIPAAHELGIYVMSVVGAVRHAQKAVADGVDAVIASGMDGGGHVGRIGTATLVPSVVDAVDVPVLAGGGLADGRGLAAALAFGAQGVWMGTRFIATPESLSHENYKRRIANTDVAGTVITRAHSGKPCRLISNNFTRDWAGREAEIKPFPLQALEVGHAASDAGRIKGDVENGVLPTGQSCGVIHDVVPAGEVVRAVVDEASAALERMRRLT